MRLLVPVPAATALVGRGDVKRTHRCDGDVKAHLSGGLSNRNAQ
jgi:hypothetical protein